MLDLNFAFGTVRGIGGRIMLSTSSALPASHLAGTSSGTTKPVTVSDISAEIILFSVVL